MIVLPEARSDWDRALDEIKACIGADGISIDSALIRAFLLGVSLERESKIQGLVTGFVTAEDLKRSEQEWRRP